MISHVVAVDTLDAGNAVGAIVTIVLAVVGAYVTITVARLNNRVGRVEHHSERAANAVDDESDPSAPTLVFRVGALEDDFQASHRWTMGATQRIADHVGARLPPAPILRHHGPPREILRDT